MNEFRYSFEDIIMGEILRILVISYLSCQTEKKRENVEQKRKSK